MAFNYSDACDLARELSNVSEADYSDTRLLPFFNRVKDDLWSYLITWVNEDYNWDIWKTTSVVNQSEYVIAEAATDSLWVLQINWVSINYDWETHDDWSLKYIKAKRVRLWNLSEDWEYYTNNQSKSNPIYYIADKSIFIAPHPSSAEAWSNRIKLKWIKSIVDYTTSTVEANIWIPSFLFDILIQWVLPYIHRSEWRKDEASFELKEYKEQRDLAVKKFSERDQWTYYMTLPDEQEVGDYTINLD